MLNKTLLAKDVKKIIEGFANAENPHELLQFSLENVNLLGDLKSIIALDEYDRAINPHNMNEMVDKHNNYIVPYFSSHKLYFIDYNILRMMISNEVHDVNIDFSVMFDSNFASYIHKFVRKIPMKSVSNDFDVLIGDMIRNGINFDYMFYIFENYKNIRLLEDPCNSEEYKAIVENLKSLELFKSIDIEGYKKNGHVKYQISEKQANDLAVQFAHDFYFHNHSRSYLEKLFNMKNMILLALIGIVRIKYQDKGGADNKMKDYFEFVHENIGINLERETLLAYEYFKNSKEVIIFKKIYRGMDTSNLVGLLDNIAWDFMVPRIMENAMTYMGEGDYILPYFLSFDKGLIRMLKLFEIKGILIDKERLKCYPFMEKGYADTFNNEKLIKILQSQFSVEKAEARKDKCDNTKMNFTERFDCELEKLTKTLLV